MYDVLIGAKVGDSAEVQLSFNLPSNLEAAVRWAGEDAVFNAYQAEERRLAQTLVRSCIKGGLSPEASQAKADVFVVGVRQARIPVDPVLAFRERAITLKQQGKTEELLALANELKDILNS